MTPRIAPLTLMTLIALSACRNTKVDSTPDSNSETAIDSDAPVDADGDGVLADDDCDDDNAEVYPGAAELCDGLDNNCDGEVDEGATSTWYADGDADGWGDDASATEACEAPSGAVAQGGDCDDADANYNPGAVEEDCADPNDYNCDGSVGYADEDGDGWAACEECDDLDAGINPDATEICDAVDNDCDGDIDDADADLDTSTGSDWFHDSDGDGYGDPNDLERSCNPSAEYIIDSSDCDDADAAVNPAASEVCNGTDDDCDALIDDADDSLDSSTTSTWYADADADSYGDPANSSQTCSPPSGYLSDSSDCDDANAAINPGASEVCNGTDDDCDALVDDADSSLDSSTASTWYADSDGDGFGDSSVSALTCDAPNGYLTDSTDCDDADAAIHPNASEVCNGVDDDCDALTDDADGSLDSSTASTWYADADADGYGDSGVSALTCDAPSGYLADDSDCNDGDATLYPESDGTCATGGTCKQILDDGFSAGDGTYTIDPDGSTTGLDPFTVTCDMSTDSGGWTEVAYAADLTYQRQFTSGDGNKWLTGDFTLSLSSAQITAIQALSTEGTQTYVGLCNGVVHYYYSAGNSHAYAFGFRFLDGTETPFNSSSYAPYDVTVTQDGCIGNGGEGGTEANATIFEISSPLVPVVNVHSRDNGDGSERFGSPLTSNSAWLR